MTGDRATTDDGVRGEHGPDGRGDAADLRVLSFPDYRSANPYQRALTDALGDRGVAVETHDGKTPVLPLSRVALAGEHPDVVHVHFLNRYVILDEDRHETLGSVVATLVSCLLGLQLVVDLALVRLAGVRVVWTAHDLLNHERRAVGVERAVKHVLVRLVCHAVVVHCERAGDLLVETFGLPETVRGKLTVVPHGHFLDHYADDHTRETARERLDVATDGPVFLFFGWIRRYKNVVALVETFAALDAPDARLLVVGNPRTDALDRAVRAAAADDPRVRLRLEFVPDEAVGTYMSAADAVVLPFRTDDQTMLTSGSVVLAMGFGRAVVTPRLGCVPELLGEGGVLYDHDAELGDALRRATDADLDRMGQRNRRRVARLDWDGIAERTRAVYEERPLPAADALGPADTGGLRP